MPPSSESDQPQTPDQTLDGVELTGFDRARELQDLQTIPQAPEAAPPETIARENQRQNFNDLEVAYKEAATDETGRIRQGIVPEFQLELGEDGTPTKRIYNTTAPFNRGNKTYIITRRELKKTEPGLPESEVVYFELGTNADEQAMWTPSNDIAFPSEIHTPVDDMVPELANTRHLDAKSKKVVYEDPRHAKIVIGGKEYDLQSLVKVISLDVIDTTALTFSSGPERASVSRPKQIATIPEQAFFLQSGDSNEQTHIATGHAFEKGTTVEQLSSLHEGMSRFAVLTRPQGGEFGPGRICYTEFEAATREEFEEKLSASLQNRENVIPDLCDNEEWVGPGKVTELEDGTLGIEGHIARWLDKDKGIRQYCTISFAYDPTSKATSERQITAMRDMFEGTENRADRDDLHEVVYYGGTLTKSEFIELGLDVAYPDIQLQDDEIVRFLGVGDAHPGITIAKDPFYGRRLQARPQELPIAA